MRSVQTIEFSSATRTRQLVANSRLAGVLSLTALLLLAAPVQAQQSRVASRQRPQEFDREALTPDTMFRGPDSVPIHGVRCATRPVSPLEARLVRARLKKWRREQSRAGNFAASSAALSIPVAFHVVTDGGSGDVSDSQIDQQIDVLSAAFSSAGFSFHRASIDRTDNAAWYSGCAGGEEMPMKNALAIDPITTLNVYTCDPSDGILGYSYLPQDNSESDPTHGVVLLYSTLPGGSAVPYDEGDTGTHEVGHYLGLLHTFDGGCEPGDEVDDTEPEDSPAYGCPSGQDSCPGGGTDPIENFMDYTDDACMDTFTSQQGARMRDMVGAYKPSLGSPPPPATLERPTLVSPTGNTGEGTPTYQWSPVNNAESYRLRVMRDGSAVQDSTYSASDICSGSSCSAASSSTLGDGDYSWKVLASNGAGESPWSTTLDFTISSAPDLPGQPSAQTPNGTIDASTPDFTWDAASGADNYRLKVIHNGSTVQDSTYSASGACDGNTCSATSNSTLEDGDYSWQVAASNAAGQGSWSSLDFTVSTGDDPPDLPDQPTAQAPSGTIDMDTPTFQWDAASGAENYRLKVIHDGSTVEDSTYSASGACSGDLCSAESSSTLEDGSYSWQIAATNDAGQGSWSSLDFTVSTGDDPPDLPDEPLAWAPSGIIDDPLPIYEWDAADRADSYRLRVMRDGLTVQDSTYPASEVCSGIDCWALSSSTLEDGDYSWKVLASNADGDGPTSSAMSFTVSTEVTPDLPFAPFAIAPWGDVGTSTPTYLWGEVPGALEYEVRIEAQGSVVHQARYAASICEAGLCELTSAPAPSLSPGYHRWSVRARNQVGDGPWSDTQPFRIRVTLGRTILIGPEGKVTTFQPVYQWQAVAGATEYQIVVRGPGGTIRQRVVANQSCDDATCSVGSPTMRTLLGGRYRWWVRARAGASKGPRSTRKSFRVIR